MNVDVLKTCERLQVINSVYKKLTKIIYRLLSGYFGEKQSIIKEEILKIRFININANICGEKDRRKNYM